ncbi:MAG TPA: LysM peptidoglycan-binding domain-containing protein [Verrucomicrobiae bacterium]|jgi:LysM repeat protein|nr:LysM peptidoglycan-binding domain-containing protein [Verrucomicrobiae bacterium]
MDFRNRVIFSVFAVCLGGALNGCDPSDQNGADDEKEPHFILGQNRVNAMDYSGAVEAFEESLEANPHSAQAHYQLAMLYGEKENNPAAAIYHYQQYLRFDPKAPNADIVNQHIIACKQQLAADVLQLPSSSAAQQQLQQLADKNRQLQDEVDKWRAYYASQTAKTNLPPTPGNIALQPVKTVITQQPTVSNPNPAVARPRTHTVVANETPAAIARKFGVSLNALLAANPSLQPTHMRVGQIINLPPP